MALRSQSLTDPQYLFLMASDKALEDTLKKIDCKKNVTIVDIGAGNMWLKKYFQNQGAIYFGFDLNTKHKPHTTSLAENLPLKNHSVNTLLYISVFEHLENPQQTLREAKRVLIRNGKIIIHTHGIYPYHPFPQDYWRWTHTGLKNILNSAGFKTIAIYPSGNTLTTYLTFYITGLNIFLEKIPLLSMTKKPLTVILNFIGIVLLKFTKLKTSPLDPGNLIMNYSVVAESKKN